ncbi:swi2 snf2 srcap ino80, partial [Cystoisospora suis]
MEFSSNPQSEINSSPTTSHSRSSSHATRRGGGRPSSGGGRHRGKNFSSSSSSSSSNSLYPGEGWPEMNHDNGEVPSDRVNSYQSHLIHHSQNDIPRPHPGCPPLLASSLHQSSYHEMPSSSSSHPRDAGRGDEDDNGRRETRKMIHGERTGGGGMSGESSHLDAYHGTLGSRETSFQAIKNSGNEEVLSSSPTVSSSCHSSSAIDGLAALEWMDVEPPLEPEVETAKRILQVQEEQRQILLLVQKQREEAKARGEVLPDEPPPDLARRMCGVDDHGNLLHPRCMDMKQFVQGLGGIYLFGEGKDEEENEVRNDIKHYKKCLEQVHIKMGKIARGTSASGGDSASGSAAPVGPAPREPSRQHLIELAFVHRDIFCREMKEFQGLVIDEHKEKKKLFRQLASGCRKQVDLIEKKKQTKIEEEERRVRGLAKTVCTTVELFWKRIERVVWEGEKRKLMRQLHEKKRKKLDRLVRQAMKKCKLLARGLRESRRAPGSHPPRAKDREHKNSSSLSSSSTSSSRRSSCSEAGERGRKRKERKKEGHTSSSSNDTKGKMKKGREKDDVSPPTGEAKGTAKKTVQDKQEREEQDEEEEEEGNFDVSQFAGQEEEDQRLDAMMEEEEGEGEDTEDEKDELAALQAEADMPLEDLKKLYGGDRRDSEKDKEEEEEEKTKEGEEEEGDDGGEGEDFSEDAFAQQEEEDKALDAALDEEEDEDGKEQEEELRDLQEEANLPIEELLKRCYGVSGDEDELRKDRARKDTQRTKQDEKEEEGEGEEEEAEEGEDLKVDPESLARQEEEDEELDAAMDEDEDEEDKAEELKALQEDADLPLEELIKRYGSSPGGVAARGGVDASSPPSEEEVVIPVRRRSARVRSRQAARSSSHSPVEDGSPSKDGGEEEGRECDGDSSHVAMSADSKTADEEKGREGGACKRSRRSSSSSSSAHQSSSSSVHEERQKSDSGEREETFSPQRDQEKKGEQQQEEEVGDAKKEKKKKSRKKKKKKRRKKDEWSSNDEEEEESESDDLFSSSSSLSTKLISSVKLSEEDEESDHPVEKEECRDKKEKKSGESASITAEQRRHNPAPELIRATLRTYQMEGVKWLYALHNKGLNGILADEMGLGKTLQTIAFLACLAVKKNIWGPHLIVVPTSVMLNWEMEFLKFSPGFKILVYYGSAQDRARKRIGWSRPYAFHVCIVSYSTVVKDAPMFRRKKWYSLILDEAQNIKNFHSRRWQVLLTFNTQHRLLLTGTPLQNNLVELWSLLHFLMPQVFESHTDFKEWFSDPLTTAIEQEQVNDHKLLLEKLHALLRPYLLRRLKKDVEKQMPCKYEHVVRCILTKRQRCLYDEFIHRRQVQQTLDVGNYRGMLNILMQLRKVCNHPDLFEPRHIETPVGGGGVDCLSQDLPALVCLWLFEPWNWSLEERLRRVTLPILSLIHYEMKFSSLQHQTARHLSPLLLLSKPPPVCLAKPRVSSFSSSSSSFLSPLKVLTTATAIDECDVLSLPQPVYTTMRKKRRILSSPPSLVSLPSFSSPLQSEGLLEAKEGGEVKRVLKAPSEKKEEREEGKPQGSSLSSSSSLPTASSHSVAQVKQEPHSMGCSGQGGGSLQDVSQKDTIGLEKEERKLTQQEFEEAGERRGRREEVLHGVLRLHNKNLSQPTGSSDSSDSSLSSSSELLCAVRKEPFQGGNSSVTERRKIEEMNIEKRLKEEKEREEANTASKSAFNACVIGPNQNHVSPSSPLQFASHQSSRSTFSTSISSCSSSSLSSSLSSSATTTPASTQDSHFSSCLSFPHSLLPSQQSSPSRPPPGGQRSSHSQNPHLERHHEEDRERQKPRDGIGNNGNSSALSCSLPSSSPHTSSSPSRRALQESHFPLLPPESSAPQLQRSSSASCSSLSPPSSSFLNSSVSDSLHPAAPEQENRNIHSSLPSALPVSIGLNSLPVNSSHPPERALIAASSLSSCNVTSTSSSHSASHESFSSVSMPSLSSLSQAHKGCIVNSSLSHLSSRRLSPPRHMSTSDHKGNSSFLGGERHSHLPPFLHPSSPPSSSLPEKSQRDSIFSSSTAHSQNLPCLPSSSSSSLSSQAFLQHTSIQSASISSLRQSRGESVCPPPSPSSSSHTRTGEEEEKREGRIEESDDKPSSSFFSSSSIGEPLLPSGGLSSPLTPVDSQDLQDVHHERSLVGDQPSCLQQSSHSETSFSSLLVKQSRHDSPGNYLSSPFSSSSASHVQYHSPVPSSSQQQSQSSPSVFIPSSQIHSTSSSSLPSLHSSASYQSVSSPFRESQQPSIPSYFETTAMHRSTLSPGDSEVVEAEDCEDTDLPSVFSCPSTSSFSSSALQSDEQAVAALGSARRSRQGGANTSTRSEDLTSLHGNRSQERKEEEDGRQKEEERREGSRIVRGECKGFECMYGNNDHESLPSSPSLSRSSALCMSLPTSPPVERPTSNLCSSSSLSSSSPRSSLSEVSHVIPIEEDRVSSYSKHLETSSFSSCSSSPSMSLPFSHEDILPLQTRSSQSSSEFSSVSDTHRVSRSPRSPIIQDFFSHKSSRIRSAGQLHAIRSSPSSSLQRREETRNISLDPPAPSTSMRNIRKVENDRESFHVEGNVLVNRSPSPLCPLIIQHSDKDEGASSRMNHMGSVKSVGEKKVGALDDQTGVDYLSSFHTKIESSSSVSCLMKREEKKKFRVESLTATAFPLDLRDLLSSSSSSVPPRSCGKSRSESVQEEDEEEREKRKLTRVDGQGGERRSEAYQQIEREEDEDEGRSKQEETDKDNLMSTSSLISAKRRKLLQYVATENSEMHSCPTSSSTISTSQSPPIHVWGSAVQTPVLLPVKLERSSTSSFPLGEQDLSQAGVISSSPSTCISSTMKRKKTEKQEEKKKITSSNHQYLQEESESGTLSLSPLSDKKMISDIPSSAPSSWVLTRPFGSTSLSDIEGFLKRHAMKSFVYNEKSRLLHLRNFFPISRIFVNHIISQQDGQSYEDLSDSYSSSSLRHETPLTACGDLASGGYPYYSESIAPLGGGGGVTRDLSGGGGSAGSSAASHLSSSTISDIPHLLDLHPPLHQNKTSGVGVGGGGASHQYERVVRRLGSVWRKWLCHRVEERTGLYVMDETGDGWRRHTRDGMYLGDIELASLQDDEWIREVKQKTSEIEERSIEICQQNFLLESELSLLSPPPFGGSDCRDLLKKEILTSPRNPVSFLHQPIRTCEDYLERGEVLREICLTASEIFERDRNLLIRCSVICNPRVQPGHPRIYLRGPGGITSRDASFSAFQEVQKEIQESVGELHEAVERQRRIFPCKQTLQDDCGKLIVLAELLMKLRADNHRCLLFTQFSKMLDVLEAWINHQGFTYVRLDGSTKVDQRQRIVTRFNSNPRIFLFISSTRAGGVGLNLTGADTVIFYDTDWNPAMDKQAMDRCHRIGQTRDVHVYRLVSEHSIEENIWRKQLQKRLLDEVVVDQGLFTMENTTKEMHLSALDQATKRNKDEQATQEWFSTSDTLKELLASP